MRLAEAQDVARTLKAMLEHHSVATEVLIAGSVRRQKAEPKDVELVFKPVYRNEENPEDLFLGVSKVNQQLKWIRRQLEESSDWAHRPDTKGHNCCGEGVQRLVYRGVPVDFFGVVPPSSYGQIVALRTGPKDFNLRIIACAGRNGYFLRGGRLLRAGRFITPATEREFFSEIGMPWTPPQERR